VAATARPLKYFYRRQDPAAGCRGRHSPISEVYIRQFGSKGYVHHMLKSLSDMAVMAQFLEDISSLVI
jgi:hypothetical protein